MKRSEATKSLAFLFIEVDDLKLTPRQKAEFFLEELEEMNLLYPTYLTKGDNGMYTYHEGWEPEDEKK